MSPLILSTPQNYEDFFKLLKCRVKINESQEGSVIKVKIKVPKSSYHFMRWYLAQTVPMGILFELSLLGFWECRVEKYQFNWIERN